MPNRAEPKNPPVMFVVLIIVIALFLAAMIWGLFLA